MTRNATTGKAAKARRLKAEKPKRSAAPAVNRRRRLPDADIQDQLEQKTRELAEARKLLAESLEQQTATSEVLQVISGSSGNLEPTFKSILANAVRLCDARFGTLFRYEGGMLHVAAQHGTPEALVQFQNRRGAFFTERGTLHDRVLQTKQVAHTVDYAAEPSPGAAARVGGARSTIIVPLIKDDEPIGTIVIFRQEVRPFTDKQIELIQNFAAQAVIAIENTRLLNALRESLEQQTATADVLKVISRSTFDLQAVLDTLVQSAAKLCSAERTVFMIAKGGLYHHLSDFGFSPEVSAQMSHEPVKPIGGSMVARVLAAGAPVHVIDAQADPEEVMTRRGKLSGTHSFLGVPLMREGAPVGVLLVQRSVVQPFTEQQIGLATTFADQAVIAIENTRLLNELRQRTDDLTESLEQQTATSEVLGVISSSPGDLHPVFRAILENATRICEAKLGTLALHDKDGFRIVAEHGGPKAYSDQLQTEPLVRRGPGTVLDQVAKTKQPVHIADLAAQPELAPRLSKFADARTILMVPMLKEDEFVGVVGIYRQEVRPFTDKQIELVKNFAAQAVIAIENARLLNELRQSLDRQTATSEVLKVISSSPGELGPVFGAMLENATRICEAKLGTMVLHEHGAFRHVASHGAPPAYTEFRKREPLIRLSLNHPLARLRETRQVFHTPDIAAAPEDARGRLVDLAGARTMVIVPMLKEGDMVGAISIYRQEVRPFTDKQIELLQNFAAQAVIAIENTRLLNELRQRTDDLTESLEQQMATSEVLKVISSSPGDLEPVFRAMLENATRICGAKFGTLNLYDGDVFQNVALYNAPPGYADKRPKSFRPHPESGLAHVARTKQVAHINDIRAEPPYLEGNPIVVALADFAGARTLVIVPMLKENELIGTIGIYRQQIQPFTDKQIELLGNFAAQAVIAIENTRLLNELRESLQQQTATADVLKVISRSTFELQPVFDSMAESAVRLCEAERAYIFRFDGEVLRAAASFNAGPEHQDQVYRNPIPLGRHSISARAGLERRTVQVADIQADPEYNYVARDVGLVRTTLAVPMLKGDELIGTITIYRLEVKPFTENQIALMETFADQAVIAIENARLFENLQTRTRELAQSLEDLQAAQDCLVQTQKLASLGQLTAGIAHEIKNPLNFVNNFSALSSEMLDELQQVLQRGQFDQKTRSEIDELTETLRANLDKIEQHGKRADSIVKNMLLHSREGSGEHRPVDINAVVEESLNLAYHGARAEKQGFNITLERSLDPNAGEVDVFPQEITRVLLNLIANGFYAATKRKEQSGDGYEPMLSAATKNLGERVEIRIRDNGIGIPSEVKDKMFNPFFTTKPAGEGTGLGLSLSHDIIVKQHAGSIEVDTEPGSFTEIRIILPRAAATIAKTGAQP
jgi:GAF domain-containing protein